MSSCLVTGFASLPSLTSTTVESWKSIEKTPEKEVLRSVFPCSPVTSARAIFMSGPGVLMYAYFLITLKRQYGPNWVELSTIWPQLGKLITIWPQLGRTIIITIWPQLGRTNHTMHVVGGESSVTNFICWAVQLMRATQANIDFTTNEDPMNRSLPSIFVGFASAIGEDVGRIRQYDRGVTFGPSYMWGTHSCASC